MIPWYPFAFFHFVNSTLFPTATDPRSKRFELSALVRLAACRGEICPLQTCSNKRSMWRTFTGNGNSLIVDCGEILQSGLMALKENRHQFEQKEEWSGDLVHYWRNVCAVGISCLTCYLGTDISQWSMREVDRALHCKCNFCRVVLTLPARYRIVVGF